MGTTTTSPRSSSIEPRSQLQNVAAILAAAIAVLYGLLFAGVLTLPGDVDAELGILGVAGAVFVVLAGLLWWRRSRVLWVAAAVLQLLLGAMYIAIAPDRDPAYEVWGVTIRVVSFVLLLVLVRLLLAERRAGEGGRA